MTGVDQGVVEIEGGAISWEAAGEGSAVAFLHPGLWDRRTWDEQFDTFSRTYRVVRHDARGYGRSGRPEPGRPYSHVRDLMAVLDAAGVDRAALVGCSMGGGIAIDAALEHPERVSALVLAAPGLGGFEGSSEEEAGWGSLGGGAGSADRGCHRGRRSGSRTGPAVEVVVGPAGNRRPRRAADPGDRVRQPPGADDG